MTKKNLYESISPEIRKVVKDSVDNYFKDNPKLLSSKIKDEVADLVGSQELDLTEKQQLKNNNLSISKDLFGPKLSERISANLDKQKSKTHSPS